MPKLPFTKKGTVKPMEWVETIDHRGKVCWVERPLNPPRYSEEAHMEHPRHLEHPDNQKHRKLGVPWVQQVRSLVVLMTIISAMMLLRKTKVGTL